MALVHSPKTTSIAGGAILGGVMGASALVVLVAGLTTFLMGAVALVGIGASFLTNDGFSNVRDAMATIGIPTIAGLVTWGAVKLIKVADKSSDPLESEWSPHPNLAGACSIFAAVAGFGTPIYGLAQIPSVRYEQASYALEDWISPPEEQFGCENGSKPIVRRQGNVLSADCPEPPPPPAPSSRPAPA